MKTTGTAYLRFSNYIDAQAYVTACNAKENFIPSWYPKLDVSGKWCAPFYGSPYIKEPTGFDKLRTNAEMVNMLYWPEETAEK